MVDGDKITGIPWQLCACLIDVRTRLSAAELATQQRLVFEHVIERQRKSGKCVEVNSDKMRVPSKLMNESTNAEVCKGFEWDHQRVK